MAEQVSAGVLKQLGNEAFCKAKYTEAIEFYTRGLAVEPLNHVRQVACPGHVAAVSPHELHRSYCLETELQPTSRRDPS